MQLLVGVVKNVMIGIVLLTSATSVFAKNIELPSGWRAPIASELNEEWRSKDPNKYALVQGDFNGDGVEDQAMLLVSKQRHALGLFVFLSQKNQTFKKFLVDLIKDATQLQAMGIARVPPGRFKTACGKGYWKCKNKEAPEVSIQHEAIDYFKEESGNSYFYWDEQRKIFKRIWISD
jgi:hypothetical protein